jgi:uncharacterized membrane protein
VLEESKSKRTVVLSTASVYAAIYVTLVYVFNPISYGQVNLRVANVIIGLIPLLGWPGVIGQTLGVFVANLASPLGPIDLINVIPSFAFSWLIWRLRKKSVFLGLTLYSVALGATVSFALNYAFGLPLALEIPYVTLGIFLATAVFGYIFYQAVQKTGVLQRRFETEPI